MLFASTNFLFFVFVCFCLYYLLPKRFQWCLLLVASYGFYFSAGRFYPIFLFVITCLTYTTALLIEQSKKREKQYLKENAQHFTDREKKKGFKNEVQKKRRNIVCFGFLSCLFILGIFKYTDFVIENINTCLQAFQSNKELPYFDLLLPMGISFYTFQAIGYLLDVYWGKIEAQKNFLKYMLFLAFFPQLVQGPISRYDSLSKTLYEQHPFDKREIMFGIQRVIWGYFKKLVIADTILIPIKTLCSDEYYNGIWVFILIIFYGIQLYADFTGGIDITIGIAQMFGIRLEENFIRPFFSKNIVEYWRRWHISMGTWFRDYVFYPMSISKTMNKITKKSRAILGEQIGKRVPVYTATMVTWFATGIWHGASWNFIMWGVLNGVIILTSSELQPLYRKFHSKFPSLQKARWFEGFQVIRTFFLMGSLRLFDCYQDVPTTFSMFFSMFSSFHIRAINAKEFLDLGLTIPQYCVVGLGILCMFFVSLFSRKKRMREQIAEHSWIFSYLVFVSLLFAILLFGAYGIGYDEAQFIYNQF